MASNKTVILDGYPRTVSQAQSLTKTGIKFTAVDINLERSIAVDKLLSRVNCSKCGKGFNTSEIMTDGYVMPALLPTKSKIYYKKYCLFYDNAYYFYYYIQ